jgi:AraC-like DNA-binding protein
MLTPSMSAGIGSVGLRSVGSFTTSFGRTFGLSPRAYRAAHPGGRPRADPDLHAARTGAPTIQQFSRRQPCAAG